MIIKLTCVFCPGRIQIPAELGMGAATGLYMSHLIGEHWERLSELKAELGPVTPGAWERIAADWSLPRAEN